MFPWSRKKKDDEAIDPEARSPELGLKYKDLQLMGELMKLGAKLALPRHALYYLYLPSQQAAEAGAEEGRTAGYQCEVREPLPENPEQWTLLCERPDAVLDPKGVLAADDLFQGIADRHGGDFDGWEAAAEP